MAAVREYQESIRIKSENPAAYVGISNVREARGDLELSIAELRSGLELMPNNGELLTRVGEQSLRVDKSDDAIKAFETALGVDPANARAADGLTTAYYMKAQKETTGGYFGNCVRLLGRMLTYQRSVNRQTMARESVMLRH